MNVFRVAPGQTLDGRFYLTEELARGGMSTVFKARDLDNDHAAVVVKVPLPIYASGVGTWSMFQREGQIGRRLDHPFVLRYLPLGEDPRRSYVATEFVPGPTLAEHIAARGQLPEAEALAIASQLAAAIEHVHGQQFVHYDLKPTNVMLCPDGTIRLIDFGLAHAAVKRRFALLGSFPAIGSSGYVAPEQIRHKRGRKSVDIYGIGAVLYEMLTGRQPFPGDDPFRIASARVIGDPPRPSRLSPRISPQVEEIVLRALRRNPAERYASAAALRADLDDPARVVVSGLAERLQPPTPWRRALHLARYVAIIAFVPLLTQIGLFYLLWHHFANRHGH
jgi:serine/threonine protein kinase